MPLNNQIVRNMAPNQVFGRLKIVKLIERRNGKPYWECLCLCGTTTIKDAYSLASKASQSCGCFARERASVANLKHGASVRYHTERLYRIWQKMRDRCMNPNNQWFHNYGGRGINICNEWSSSECYPIFRDWARAHGYEDTLTLERLNYDGPYCPENCAWIPKSEQSANRRTNIWLRAFGETKLIKAWARDRRCAITAQSLAARIRQGWPAEKAISEPATYGNQHKHFER